MNHPPTDEIIRLDQGTNTADPTQWIKDFYILEAAIFSEELDERVATAAKIVSSFQTKEKLDSDELTVVDDINNWVVHDLVNIREKIPISLIAGLINLGLEYGNRHWCLLASEFSTELTSAAPDTITEFWARTGRTIDIRFIPGNPKKHWLADYARNLLNFSKISTKGRVENPEEAWQTLYTNTLNDPAEFASCFKELKKPLSSDAQIKFRIYLLTLAFNIKSSTINIQNPVNIVRNHISKRSDSFQLVLLTNISLFLQDLTSEKTLDDFPKSIFKTLENVRKLRRLDEVYLATAALYKILIDKFGINIAKDLLHEHTASTCMFSENGREAIISPVFQMMLHYEPGLIKVKNSRINLFKLKTGALLLISRLALTVNRAPSPKNIENLWHIVGDILEAYPGDVSGLVHKMMQFAPTMHKYIPERVHAVIQRRYLDGVVFSDINPESFIARYNESNPITRIKSFSRQPVAIGSLGQVFKGIATDGTALAIKIKKPGIDKTIINQVKQVKPLEFVFKALNRNFNYLDLTNAMQDVFLQECNYKQEAIHQKIFFDLFENHPKISVPAIFSEPNKDIIVQEFSDGITFEEFLANSSQAERNKVAELVVESVLIQLKNGYFNYDIHPGNFLLTPDHSLILIDFGAVLSGEDLNHCSPWNILHFIKHDDKEGLKNTLLKSGFYRESNLVDMQEKMTLFRTVYYRPFFIDGNFEVTDQFLRDIMTNQLEVELKTGRAVCSSTRTITIMRFYWSFYSMLSRLQAQINFAEKFRNACHSS